VRTEEKILAIFHGERKGGEDKQRIIFARGEKKRLQASKKNTAIEGTFDDLKEKKKFVAGRGGKKKSGGPGDQEL